MDGWHRGHRLDPAALWSREVPNHVRSTRWPYEGGRRHRRNPRKSLDSPPESSPRRGIPLHSRRWHRRIRHQLRSSRVPTSGLVLEPLRVCGSWIRRPLCTTCEECRHRPRAPRAARPARCLAPHLPQVRKQAHAPTPSVNSRLAICVAMGRSACLAPYPIPFLTVRGSRATGVTAHSWKQNRTRSKPRSASHPRWRISRRSHAPVEMNEFVSSQHGELHDPPRYCSGNDVAGRRSLLAYQWGERTRTKHSDKSRNFLQVRGRAFPEECTTRPTRSPQVTS
jgi:hypothetical protein